MFEGSMVALITPMHPNGMIDKKALIELVEWHIQEDTKGIIAAGTTGESATIDPEEHYEMISLIVAHVKGRIPVIAGAGTNSTKSTLLLADNARRAKADGCLIVTPYYNRPPQNGLYEHYAFIAKEIDLPIILYNVPTRTACDILPETVERLSKINNIIGIKEATAKIERTKEILDRCHANFKVYSGDDLTALLLMTNGAHGVISVTANIAPKKMQAMCRLALNGEHEAAEKINDSLLLLHKNLFLESNPIPTKWALTQMGKIASGIRLPLLTLDKQYHDEVKKAMQIAGVQ